MQTPIGTNSWNRLQLLRDANGAFDCAVSDAQYPCVGARAALHAGSYLIGAYEELGSAASAGELHKDLRSFLNNETLLQNEYSTFVAVFQFPAVTGEKSFESALWKHLEALHEVDADGFTWDPSVSADVGHAEFSFSVCGQAFYIVGMHPDSSRLARRFPFPALVFNRHAQFQQLREDGKWQRMQNTIRERELELQGSLNPMVTDFGIQSEARQYSGRAVPADWKPPLTDSFPKSGGCPFHH